MRVLGIILARAGSRGLPGKCLRPVLGRPMIEYTFDHALASRRLNQLILSTDSTGAKALAKARGIRVVDRPRDLATDEATVDDAARHALAQIESQGAPRADIVVFLYGNVPVRAPGVIDRAVRHLIETEADSVRTVAPLTKHHPDWTHRLDGDCMVQFRANNIFRRQDLEVLYFHDGAVAVVTRNSLFTPPAHPDDFHAFFGADRRAIVQQPEDTVDVDSEIDLWLAEAVLKARGHHAHFTTSRQSEEIVNATSVEF